MVDFVIKNKKCWMVFWGWLYNNFKTLANLGQSIENYIAKNFPFIRKITIPQNIIFMTSGLFTASDLFTLK